MTLPDNSVFSARAITLLILAGVLTFAGAAYFMIFGNTGISTGANSYSRSAIGHMGFVELLRRQGFTVIVSKHESAAKARDGALLVLAEPLTRRAVADDGLPLAERTLLILPKWRGQTDRENLGWVGRVAQIPAESVQKTLQIVLPDATLVRPGRPVRWGEVSLRALYRLRPNRPDNDLLWNRMRSRAAPAIAQPQLIEAPGLTPIVAGPEGVLVGGMRVGGRWVFIISDPDLLSNHGLDDGENARHFIDAMSLFRAGDAPIVIDETIHGFSSDPNLWRKMFEPPYFVATLLAVAAIVILLWASAGRFGAPHALPEDSRVADTGLIEIGVNLLHQSGQGAEIARRYPAVILRQVTQRLHTPRHLSETARLDWVDRVGESRGVTERYADLLRDAESTGLTGRARREAVLRAVQRLYKWKQEMLDGSGQHRDG